MAVTKCISKLPRKCSTCVRLCSRLPQQQSLRRHKSSSCKNTPIDSTVHNSRTSQSTSFIAKDVFSIHCQKRSKLSSSNLLVKRMTRQQATICDWQKCSTNLRIFCNQRPILSMQASLQKGHPYDCCRNKK